MLIAGSFLQNRYEIINRIGSGGMADVYKARDHKLNRFVAVKVLKQEYKDDSAFISKFRVEAQAAGGLAHANIVNVYDVGEDNGVNFIVMELVEGITLKAYINKKGKLPVREATSIALQVAAGLEAAHNNGIIHRDVKPQNIIISLDGKAKVADFGIARAVSSNTINSNVMGSVHYSSPEQTRGGYSDAKSDIYSMGITMYEMLTGRVPFDGDSTVAVALKHLQEEIQPPRKLVPEIPLSTEQIILKCTQKSPDRRYGNMTELIRDLKESLVNPDGNFVVIPAIDSNAHTVLLSKEEINQIKNGTMPVYDEKLDTGAASTFTEEGNVTGEKRDYPYGGNYYQKSGYQELKHNQEPYPGGYQEPGYGTGSHAPGGYQEPGYGTDPYAPGGYQEPGYGTGPYASGGYQKPGYDTGPYASGGYGAYSGPYPERMNYEEEEEEGEDNFDPEEEEYFRRKKRRAGRRGGASDGMSARTERIVTVVSIVAAVVIGCIFLVLIGRAMGLFNLGSSTQQAGDGQEQTSQTGTMDTTAVGTVQVPDLRGKTESEAQALLRSMNLGYKYQGESPSSDYPEGQVVSQSVEANSYVEANTTVGYVLSSGSSETLTVPSLTNVDQEQAEKALTSMGLLVKLDNSRYSDTVGEGNVITTNPGAGSTVKTGDTVTVYISQGPEASLVEVPQVEGHYEADASTALTNLGLYVYVNHVNSDTVESGMVISQDVPAGSSVQTGTTITITVSDGPSNPIVIHDTEGTWMCYAQLLGPDGYSGEELPLRIQLVQNGGDPVTVFEGTTTFPYFLNVEGEAGVTTGTAYVYILDPQTWEVTTTIEYPVEFSQVE